MNVYIYVNINVLFAFTMSAVVSVRISEEVKKILKESGLNISEEVRRYLEELAWKVKIRRFIAKWDEVLKDVVPSERGFSERSVREDRESH